MDEQDWDVSVRAIAHYPTVIGMMADKIDWTTSLGQAYVNQSTDVAFSVQHLRRLARSAGNLQSSEQQEVLEHDNYIAITPYQPEYIYVPVYDPGIIYYRRPYYGPAITFGVGFPIGAWLNLDFHWGYGGGWGGLYYTGWRSEGWGSGCWNCGWIGRSRGRVSFQNNVYVNNCYNNISVNRNVINRSVNANNLNRYNSVHRSVGYNNVQVNNNRANRMTNANNGRPGNGAWNNGNNGRAGNSRVNNGNNARPGDRPLNTGYNARANNTPSGSGRGNRPGDPAGNYGSSNSQPAGNDRPPHNQPEHRPQHRSRQSAHRAVPRPRQQCQPWPSGRYAAVAPAWVGSTHGQPPRFPAASNAPAKPANAGAPGSAITDSAANSAYF